MINPDELLAAREKLENTFDPGKDRKRRPEDYDLIKANYQRMLIGETGGIKRTNPRLMRIFYNPMWSDDIFNMRGIFLTMAKVRNLLHKSPVNFAIKNPENGLWTASRIHHFPRGGGFMCAHEDTSAIDTAHEGGLSSYVTMLLVMSAKGKDFQEGGHVEINGARFL